MATVSLPRLRIPLSDSTPEVNAQLPSLENHTAKSRLQRTESYRAFHPQLDSSESDFSAHDSLYEAQLYADDKVSGEDPKEKEKSFEWQHEAPLPAVPSSSSWEWDGNQDSIAPSGDWDDGAAPRRQPRVPNPAVHGYNYDSHPGKIISKRIWVLPSLATIHEQRSNSTIRTSLSLPRIPSKRTSINTLSSTGSVTPQPSNLSPTALSSSTAPSTPTGAPLNALYKSRRRKSISLDELTLPSCRAALNAPFCSASSSSEDSNPAAHHVDITYPAVPTHPPLTRTPTPPGLPSFGSREALNYSLRHSIATPDPIFDANGESPNSSSALLAFIERVFSQPTPHSYALSAPRSIALPPGVIAQAADGTMVRGRFGVRQSAHMGMSGGTIALERHPFHGDEVPLARVTARTSFDGASQDRQPRVVRFSEEVEVAEGMCGSIGKMEKKKAWGRRKRGKNVAASQVQGGASPNHNQAGATAEASGAIPSTRRNGFLAFPPHSILHRTSTPPWQDSEQGWRQNQDQDTAAAEPAQGQDTVEPARATELEPEPEPEPSRSANAKAKARELLKNFWRNIVSAVLYGESAKTHADRGCRTRLDTRGRWWKRRLSCGGYCC